MRVSLLGLSVLLLAACVGDENVRDAARNVVTLRSGTVAELRRLRGTGPFTTYDCTPAEMLRVLESAAHRARDARGRPVEAIFASERYGEVIAKERDEPDSGYSAPFASAMMAIVHAVPGEPGRARVEIHALHRGPFDRGSVEWERDMPAWIRDALRERTSRASP